ncbi:carboxypeptidase regulatory-like domain-containing protein [Corallococcus sp. bb12-1]|uniref:carboxypeptidase regulatory-like domain-containing protein n=1 Tax=Corallococcus sp. bb12-1 TaxID=2996784 RepID=UPI00226EE717|nr:carboxypeptidase regulatory-like domain-containing protein [Corallococcus sp. bb12-1]MCY1040862.1 carboxypeptidase regulatory-like domain-containing protein [Corallococcus sp. bb12-1]
MRGRLIGVLTVLLVGCGLALFWGLRSGGPEVADERATVAPQGLVPVASAPGRSDRPDAGDTTSLAQAPSEAEGVLDVEVLVGEQPIAGAHARLYRQGTRDASPGTTAWRREGEGVTDARGHVRIASGPGRYLMAVRAPGQATLLRDVVRPQGERLTSLRVSLLPGQSLTGRTVVKRTQESLPLVELILTAHARTLEPWQRAEAPDEERVYVTSDARGAFRVEGLAPGTWRLEARAPGHARTVMERLRIPSEGPVTVALRVAGVIEGFVVDAKGLPATDAEVRVDGSLDPGVTTGAQGGFSLEVEPGSHTLSARRGDESGALDAPVVSIAGSMVRDVRIRLGPGARLEGRVVERSSGTPVEGARVDLHRSGGDEDAGRALSDAEGHFRLQGLAPGSYDARVSAPGFSSTVRYGLTVGAGERFPVELMLSRTGAVEGLVREGNGSPVAQAQVSHLAPGNDEDSAPGEARTDARGHYRLEGLPTGWVHLSVRREGATVGVVQSVEVGEDGATRADFTLGGTGTVVGVVRAARGALPQGTLSVTSLGVGSTGPGAPGAVAVGADGTFRMLLPPGGHMLLLTERGRFDSSAQQSVGVRAGQMVQVVFTWEDSRDANDYRGVVLESDGTPSPGASITLTAADGRGNPLMMDSADEEGRFSISLAPGTSMRRVVLNARNGGRSSDAVPVSAGQEVVVRLRSAASLQGRVVREDGPVRGFSLVLQLQKGFLAQGQGPREFPGERFEWKGVPAEPLKLVARTADGATGEALVTPSVGRMLEVEITLKASATVSGRVVDAVTKAPLPEAFVSIEGETHGEDRGPDEQGRFTLTDVRPGERTLIIMEPNHEHVRRPLKLQAGEMFNVGQIELAPRPPTSGSPSP